MHTIVDIVSNNRACLVRRKSPGLISIEEIMRFVQVLIDCDVKLNQYYRETDEKLKRHGDFFYIFKF